MALVSYPFGIMTLGSSRALALIAITGVISFPLGKSQINITYYLLLITQMLLQLMDSNVSVVTTVPTLTV